MKFEVLSAGDPAWADVIRQIPPENSDINFLPEWYLTWEDYEKALPKCIIAESNGLIAAYPFFMKPIEGYDLGNTYYDIQTAYGYGGIISNIINPGNNFIRAFNDKVTEWLYDNNVIAEFVREHPLLDYFKRDADSVKVRQNVFIETNREHRIPDKKARQNISKAIREKELEVMIDERMEFINEFVELYTQNTIRLNMTKYYYFPYDYFTKVRDLIGKNARLIHIKYQEKIINSSLYLFFGNKGTMHLAGSDHRFQGMRGNDLMYFAAMELSKNMGHDILNIGGGLSSDEDDSLFRFKSKFSNLHKDVSIGKKILNQDIYNQVVNQWTRLYPELTPKYQHFFLKYRMIE